MKLAFLKLMIIYVDSVGGVHSQLSKLGFFRFTTHLFLKVYRTRTHFTQQRKRILYTWPTFVVLTLSKKDIHGLLPLQEFIDSNFLYSSVVFTSQLPKKK